MYYIVETRYVGPNKNQIRYIDADRVEISTEPAKKNCSGDECFEGWCGTTNDWSVYAHGRYKTIDEARAAIQEEFGDVRELEFDDYSEDLVACYKIGKYEKMSREATHSWAFESIESDITADTTDEQIEDLIDSYEKEARREGYTLHGDLKKFMIDHREEMREERE